MGNYSPDVIHFDFSGHNAFYKQLVSKHYSCPTIISFHGDLANVKIELGSILKNLCQSADWVTSVSSYLKETTEQHIPEIRNRDSVIYARAKTPSIKPQPLPFKKPLIMGIGRLEYEKGFDILINSIPEISTKIPKIQVKIIGSGSKSEDLYAQTDRLNLKNVIYFMGSIPNKDIPAQINLSTLIVIPSRIQETFVIVALEAALMERPVVAANVGGLPEVVSSGKTGLLFEKNNPTALAKAITQLLFQPVKVILMGKSARKLV